MEKPPRLIELATAFAGGAALTLASMANFLTHNDYPFLRPEVAWVVLGLLSICAVMALFYRAQRQWGRSLLDGCLAMLFVDLNTSSPIAAVAAGVIVAAIGWRWKTSLVGPMALIGSITFLTTIIGIGRDSTWIKEKRQAGHADVTNVADKPAILHLILDEHLGIEGFREPDPDAQLLQRQLQTFYRGAGFALYGGAYSEHMHTANAIPYMLNYGRRGGQHVSKNGVEVGPAEHLELLARSGYRTTVIQSDFADLCTGNRIQRCFTYDSSSLRPTISLPLTTADRTSLIAWKFASLSDLAIGATLRLSDIFDALGRDGRRIREAVDVGPRSSTAASFAVFDLLGAQLRVAKPGDAFVAHILAPHVPSMVGSDCTPLPRSKWSYRHVPADIDVRRRDYRNQVRCTTRRVARLLRELEQSPAGRNTIIIAHGDHGSRITDVDTNEPNLGRFGDDELVATFSTLLAIKLPSGQPHYFADRQPVSAVLRDFAASGFRTVPTPAPANVKGLYLDDLNWMVRRRISLPKSWIESSPSQHGTVGGNSMTSNAASGKNGLGE